MHTKKLALISKRLNENKGWNYYIIDICDSKNAITKYHQPSSVIYVDLRILDDFENY